MRDAVRSLYNNHIHRLFVVDPQMHPVGVFALSDVIAILQETASPRPH